MANCVCNIAGAFPYLHSLGIISASLRTNIETNIIDNNILLYGPATGDLTITAYAPLTTNLSCPGRAGVSFNWDRRIECDTGSNLIIHFIPRGNSKAFIEGDVDSTIRMREIAQYRSFSASAASGPTSIYLDTLHKDGYEFYYSGVPISIDKNSGFSAMNVPFLAQILPFGSKLYLQSFNWEYTPPNVPQVSYSFLFAYTG